MCFKRLLFHAPLLGLVVRVNNTLVVVARPTLLGRATHYLSLDCISKFRASALPTRCILNGLEFDKIPKEISDLNEYEKVLIQ